MVEIPALSGVTLRPLTAHGCQRGSTTEIYRSSWGEGLDLPQWNLIESGADTLRGMQVHCFRTDYLCVVSGEIIAGLYDLRPDSPTKGQSCMMALSAQGRQALVIPTGVLHGFYFPVDTIYLQGMTTLWSGEDDHRCAWNDTSLGLNWPSEHPIVSELDHQSPSLARMREAFETAWRSA